MSEKNRFFTFMAKISIFILLILIYSQGEMTLAAEQFSVSGASQENGKWIWQFSVAYFGKDAIPILIIYVSRVNGCSD